MTNLEIPKVIQVLRWIAVLPGSFLCVVLAAFPIHWVVMLIQMFGRSGEDATISVGGKTPLAAIPPEVLERFGYALFTPLVMIIIGVKIAPSFKFSTGIALAVLWGIMFGVGMTIAISQGWGWGWLRFVITCVLGISGVAIGLSQVHKAQTDF